MVGSTCVGGRLLAVGARGPATLSVRETPDCAANTLPPRWLLRDSRDRGGTLSTPKRDLCKTFHTCDAHLRSSAGRSSRLRKIGRAAHFLAPWLSVLAPQAEERGHVISDFIGTDGEVRAYRRSTVSAGVALSRWRGRVRLGHRVC